MLEFILAAIMVLLVLKKSLLSLVVLGILFTNEISGGSVLGSLGSVVGERLKIVVYGVLFVVILVLIVI